MTGMELIPELIDKIDPAIIEAAAKGLATAIGKVAGETGIKLLGSTGEQLVDSTGKLTQAAQDVLFRISKKYVENYTERHGILKVLGMQKPISLDSVYTTVQLLNPEALQTFESIGALESVFRENKVRGFQQECPKQPGIKVANKEQYLMVLGAPGMGKTTFLRKVGLEALKRNKGDYQPNCIPVLLELKTFRTGEINFEKAIAAEFANCGLLEYQKLTDKFLEQGKLLILLDGLDEVPTQRMNEMVIAIQNFVDRHSNNRFITSCRIAAYRNNFRRFTDVAIADFDDQQIKSFITNWFISNSERGKECLTRLNSSDYQAAKELTQTPLLLTLVCILYQRSGQFPTNRSTLYERALRVLLEEWNGAKEIPIEQLYKGLDTKRKELILSQIAYDTFSEDQLFFSRRTVVKQIEKLLPELLPDEKFVDGNHVLRDIEVQHGLLVERAESIYSFSHLTIQEFLIAQHIDYENLPIEPLGSIPVLH
ncbi:MAG: NACHT domain-containing protein [Cyanobacteria bacterium P01_G01_bin.39]